MVGFTLRNGDPNERCVGVGREAVACRGFRRARHSELRDPQHLRKMRPLPAVMPDLPADTRANRARRADALHMMQAVSENRLGVLDAEFRQPDVRVPRLPRLQGGLPKRRPLRRSASSPPAHRSNARGIADGDQGWRERLLRLAVFGFLFANMRLLRLVATALRTYQHSGLQRIARQTGVLRVLHLDRLERQTPRIKRSLLCAARPGACRARRAPRPRRPA